MSALPDGVEVLAPVPSEHAHILSAEALAFVARLQRTFATRRDVLLARRGERQHDLSAGVMPDLVASPLTFTCRQICSGGSDSDRSFDKRSAIFALSTL